MDYKDKDEFHVEPNLPMTPREFEFSDVFGKYGDDVPADVLRYLRKNPRLVAKRLYKMFGDKIFDYMTESKKPKVVKLTESDLEKIVKRVISEQKKFDLKIFPGQNLQAKLNQGVLTLTSEMGNVQRYMVKTALPDGNFMFEYGKDGKYYGYHPKTKRKTEILLIKKV